MEFIKQKALLFVVFITGACVLVLEVTAVRILSPYFGNTLYSYSSILSVILGALSFGYYFGGKYADKHPEQKTFFGIIMLSGILVFLMEVVVLFFVPRFAYDLSFKTGPLILSCILFALPSFLLGTLSPYAIKLQESQNPKEGLGQLSGEVFFYSTIGSIVGSLLAGFLLIPYFGIRSIVVGTGAVLFLLGVAGTYLSQSQDSKVAKKKIFSAIVIASISFALITSVKNITAEGVVHNEDGVYERLVVFDTEYRGRPAKMLLQDRSAASALDRETGKLLFEYAQYYQLYKLTSDPSNVLIIGAGTYTIPKVMLEDLPSAKVDVVDIEPKLYEIAKNHFSIKESPRLVNHVADARRFLHDTEDSYDLIFGDAYASVYSLPTHLTTYEFFELVKSKLNSEGLFIMNVIGNSSQVDESVTLSEIRTFKEVFPNSYFFATLDANSNDNQNFVFVAYNSDNKLDLTSKEVVDHVTNKPIDLQKQQLDINKLNLSNHIVFTDNFAPIDRYSSHLLDNFKNSEDKNQEFDGDSSLDLVKQQVDFGERSPNSEGHKKTQEFIKGLLEESEMKVTMQPFEHKSSHGNFKMTNVVGRYKPEAEKRIVLGAHFDTKRFSNMDKLKKKDHVVGANDGASGVAVLLELARTISDSSNKPGIGIDFVFFDGEEAEDLKDGEWEPLGSTHFAKNLKSIYGDSKPQEGIVLDMVCDKNLEIYREANSNKLAPKTQDTFFTLGTKMHSDVFKNNIKWSIGDDHIPLNQAGIPTIVVIDFDYPYWHTTHDTIDKCSSESLEKVGDVVLKYIYSL